MCVCVCGVRSCGGCAGSRASLVPTGGGGQDRAQETGGTQLTHHSRHHDMASEITYQSLLLFVYACTVHVHVMLMDVHNYVHEHVHVHTTVLVLSTVDHSNNQDTLKSGYPTFFLFNWCPD